jgi:hypothetical protein
MLCLLANVRVGSYAVIRLTSTTYPLTSDGGHLLAGGSAFISTRP